MLDGLRRTWQKAFIWTAQNERLRKTFQSSSKVADLIQRYVGGPTTSDGVSRGAGLNHGGFRCSMFYLGEYIRHEQNVSHIVDSILKMIPLMVSADLDVHISVDPTAIGYLQSPSLCKANAFRIAQAIDSQKKDSEGFHCLMLDMEDESLVDYTISLHDELRDAGLPTGLTLQAYLLRTQEDLRRQIERGGAVRLVKGAFAAERSIAFQGQTEITRQYLALAQIMLKGAIRSSAFYPIFATHNADLQEEIAALAQAQPLALHRYEFEMLLGVQPELAARLSSRGFRVRIYVPCGSDWWGYVNRRIGESPRNALLALRAIFS